MVEGKVGLTVNPFRKSVSGKLGKSLTKKGRYKKRELMVFVG
jgi:hypothetical protein